MRRIPLDRVAAAVLAAGLVLGIAASTAQARPLPGAPSCPMFPTSNVWNRDVSTLPVASDSVGIVESIGLDAYLHPDFSSIDGGNYGIPYNVVTKATRRTRVTFYYPDESDRVAYPIPTTPRIENGSDRHILLVDRDACRLYELYDATRTGTRWSAGSGATWDLRSNRLRPAGWTSADAAGLPIMPGLVRYDEIVAGAVLHAVRFTAPRTRNAYIYPARHQSGDGDDPALPPMGLRVRLRASVDISGFGLQSRIVLAALKRYGMILADTGAPWYITGAPDPGWDDDDLHRLQEITGADFEVVDTGRLRNGVP
jgi:hypothetical protein